MTAPGVSGTAVTTHANTVGPVSGTALDRLATGGTKYYNISNTICQIL